MTPTDDATATQRPYSQPATSPTATDATTPAGMAQFGASEVSTTAAVVPVDIDESEDPPGYVWQKPPALPWFLRPFVVSTGIIIALACAVAVLYRFIGTIAQGCFFDFDRKSFSTFQHSGAICDANFEVNFIIGTLLTTELQISAVSAAFMLFDSGMMIMIIKYVCAAWEVFRLAAMIVFLSLGLPFVWYSLPALIITVIGLAQLPMLHHAHQRLEAHETAERKRRRDLIVQAAEAAAIAAGAAGAATTPVADTASDGSEMIAVAAPPNTAAGAGATTPLLRMPSHSTSNNFGATA
jgi:hypothetical protein